MPALLLLKLTLAPLLVAAATIVARMWGPLVGGLLMGLPLTTGPIFVLLTIERGPSFGAGATVGILFGLVGLAAFAVTYSAVAARMGWLVSLAVATMAFFALAAGAQCLGNDLLVAGLAAWLAQVLALALMRKQELQTPRASPPWWDLWVRMLAVAALTLAITTAAARLGPTLSGILGTYPVAITVVMVFVHRQSGPEAASMMLRGCVLSWLSFSSCFVVIGLSLQALGLAPATGLGMTAGVLTSAVVVWMRRLQHTSFRSAAIRTTLRLACKRCPP